MKKNKLFKEEKLKVQNGYQLQWRKQVIQSKTEVCVPTFKQVKFFTFQSWEIGIFKVLFISYFVRLWWQSFRHSMFLEERRKLNLWLNCQISRKSNVHIQITISYQFKCWKYFFHDLFQNLQKFPGVATPCKPPTWNKPNLFISTWPCSDSSQ